MWGIVPIGNKLENNLGGKGWLETKSKFTLSFVSFSFSFDDVEIYGNSLYAGPYCGKINPPPSISSDNSLIISFQSDSSTVYEGFEVEYSCGDFSDFSSSCYGTKTNTQICCSSINQCGEHEGSVMTLLKFHSVPDEIQ